VAYLLVMSVPLLAAPYVYVTYFEILHLPVRNIIFFVYVLAGVLLYVVVVALGRVDRTRLSPILAGTLGGAFALLTFLCLNRSHWGYFAPLIAAYGLTFLCLREGPSMRGSVTRAVLAAVVSLAGFVMLWPDQAPPSRSEQVSVRWSSDLSEVRRTEFEGRFSLAQGEPKPDRRRDENVWNYRVTDLSVPNIRGIVTHPEVLDTHFINRSTFRVQSQPPPGDHLPLGVRYVHWIQYPGLFLFVGTALFVWALGLIAPVALGSARGREALTSLETALRAPFHRQTLPLMLFVIPFALWTAQPSASPLTVALAAPAGHWDTPKRMLERLPCVRFDRVQARFTEDLFPDDPVMLPERTMCPPDVSVIEWMQAQVPVDAVFAVDRWHSYPAAMFSPQQVDVFPTFDASFVDEDRLFEEYYGFFYERMRQHRVQPFFNAVESPGERDAFVKTLGVTHILVNPTHYDELRRVLDGLPAQFVLRYTHNRWAIYEVKHSGPGAGELVLGVLDRSETLRGYGHLVHRLVGETVGFGVELAAHVLEPDLTQGAHHVARFGPERLQSGVLHSVLSGHLLHEKERVGPHDEPLDAVPRRPGERRQQAAILRDVVRRHTERFLQLHDRTIVSLDPDAIGRRAWIATRSAVDVRDGGAAARRPEQRPLVHRSAALAPRLARGDPERRRRVWMTSSERRRVTEYG
jgi:hypothetical protein